MSSYASAGFHDDDDDDDDDDEMSLDALSKDIDLEQKQARHQAMSEAELASLSPVRIWFFENGFIYLFFFFVNACCCMDIFC